MSNSHRSLCVPFFGQLLGCSIHLFYYFYYYYKVEVWPYEQMVSAQPRISTEKWEAQTPLGFWDTNDHLISARRPDFIIINKKERTCRIVNFVVSVDHRVKLEECEKRDEYLDVARELKKLWNMKISIIPMVIGVLVTVTKGLFQEF